MSRMSVRPDMAPRRLRTLAAGLMTLLLGVSAATAQSPPARPGAAARPAAASGTYSVEVIVFRRSPVTSAPCPGRA